MTKQPQKNIQEIWTQLACESKFKVIDLLYEAETGSLKDKKINCKKPFSIDTELDSAVFNLFKTYGVTVIKEYGELDETTA